MNEEKELVEFLKDRDKDVLIDLYLQKRYDNELCCYELTSKILENEKRIAELEEINRVLSNELTKNSIAKQDKIETCCGIPLYKIPRLSQENYELRYKLAGIEETVIALKNKIKEQEKLINELRKSV